jgi:hypothetical protein
MTDYLQKGKEWVSNQKELRERDSILKKRAVQHAQIHEEREKMARKARLAALEGDFSDDDRRLLETMNERLKAQSEANRAKWSKIYAKTASFLGGLTKDSHTPRRLRRKRASY